MRCRVCADAGKVKSPSPRPQPGGGPAHIGMVRLGLTESSEGLFRALTAHAPVGIFVTNAVGESVYVNERLCELTGLTLEQSLGYGWVAALHPDDADQVRSAWKVASAAGRDFAREYRFLRPDGSICWIEGSASAVCDAAGQLLGWVGVCVDLTDGKLSEERLEQAKEERALLLDRTLHAAERERMLFATELHDGPIQHLASFGYTLDRIDRRLASGDLAAGIELLRTVRKDLTREVGTLRRLMSDLHPPVLDERGIEAALREYVSDFEDRTGIQCAFVSGLGEERLNVDSETVLYRVTQEALTNVAKHSDAGQTRVELQQLQDGVSLVISDDGIGFDPALLGEFARDNRFGLLALRERVDGAGGKSRIETVPSEGTRIEVTLPSRPQARSGPRSHTIELELEPLVPPDRSARHAEASVLVVDDEPLIRGVLVALLRDRGFDVVGEAVDGAEAVTLAGRLRPDLVLMDIRMPVMDGREAARLIRDHQPRTQIVLLSGDDDRIGDADCIETGVFELVAKGGSASAICDTLDKAWRRAQEQRGRAA